MADMPKNAPQVHLAAITTRVIAVVQASPDGGARDRRHPPIR